MPKTLRAAAISLVIGEGCDACGGQQQKLYGQGRGISRFQEGAYVFAPLPVFCGGLVRILGIGGQLLDFRRRGCLVVPRGFLRI